MIGDCHCLVGGQYYDNPKPYEQELAQQRADIISRSNLPAEHFLHHDTARDAIIPHMLETMQQQNKTYAVIDGFPIPQQCVRVITLDFQPWEIVLASDGYPFLLPTLAESEQRLEQQRRDDPLNIGTFKATKAFLPGNNSFDDRTYIRFRV
jgi:glycerophosphoryl diester phosphodiesterase